MPSVSYWLFFRLATSASSISTTRGLNTPFCITRPPIWRGFRRIHQRQIDLNDWRRNKSFQTYEIRARSTTKYLMPLNDSFLSELKHSSSGLHRNRMSPIVKKRKKFCQGNIRALEETPDALAHNSSAPPTPKSYLMLVNSQCLEYRTFKINI